MKNVFFLILVIVISSCASVRVKRAGEVKNQGRYIMYALPENVVVVKLLLEEKHFYKGPYAEYAKEFLGIENAVKSNTVSFSIVKAELGEYQIPDPDQYYYFMSACHKLSDKLKVDNQSILCGFALDCKKTDNFPSFNYMKNNDLLEILFPDACNDGTLKEVTDTTYKTMQVDSSFVKVPVLKTKLEAKTFADKAEDAANHLMRIRKRKFKFLSGAYELVPESNTVEPIVEELNREEAEYLSLFTGKEFSNNFTVKLQYIPRNDTTVILAWFSEKQGLSAVQKPGFVPVSLEINSLQHLDTLRKYSPEIKKTSKGIIYRIPCRTSVSVKLNNSLILQRDFMISQNGVLHVYPSAALHKTKNGVALPPAY